jgi:hypothetical protein
MSLELCRQSKTLENIFLEFDPTATIEHEIFSAPQPIKTAIRCSNFKIFALSIHEALYLQN